MDHTIKNVTKEYAKVCNKKAIISFCYNIVLSFFMLVVCLLPIAKIETYSIGNAFQLIIDYIQQTTSGDILSINYLSYFVVFSAICLLVLILYIIGSIIKFIIIREEYDESEMQKYIYAKDENFLISFKFILKKLILLSIYFLIAYSLIEMNNIVLSKYGFVSNWNIIITIVFSLSYIKNIICNLLTIKYDEKAKSTPNELRHKNKRILNQQIKETQKAQLAEIKQKLKEAKTPQEKEWLEQEELRIKWDKSSKKFSFGLLFISLMCVAVFCCSVYYNAMFGGYNVFGSHMVAGWVVAPVDDNLLKFDRVSLNGGFYRVIKQDGYGDMNIGIQENTNNSKSFCFYGDSYDYAQTKIKELTEEINDLMPNDNTEEAFEEYLKTIEQKAKAIKVLENNSKHPYEFVSFIDGYMVDLQYNATGNDDIKWGQQEKGLKSLIFKEQITLTDKYCENKKEMNMFSVGTDFAEEFIIARVQYSDGSVRISKIQPTNIDQLNNAKAGTHTLKWSDSWGEYETKITLYNK